MSTKYKATEKGAAYFITITTVGWVDVFTRVRQKYVIINALEHCQRYKGLEIYAYCLMSNHLHLICRATGKNRLIEILRDFKKYTSKKIIRTINEFPESRREWLLTIFKESCRHLKRYQNYKVWQDGYHAEILYSNSFIKQKLDYIHNNPVQQQIVEYPEEYIFSSARNYCGREDVLKIITVFMG